MKNITLVTCLHGNEPKPHEALRNAGELHIVANPRALSLGARYVDKDMNGSFGSAGSSYEELRALEVLGEIPESHLVLDFHTMSADSPPFAIVVDPELIPFARTLAVPYIVVMNFNIKTGNALINHRKGISIEVGKHQDSVVLDRTLSILEHARKGRAYDPEIFEVFDTIKEEGSYENFVEYRSEGLSFFPVLAGEQTYSFPGLRAKRYNMQ